MKKYLRALLRSFHDPLQYRETLTAWQGMGGLYALFIGAVTALLLVLYLGFTFLRFQATMLPQVMDRLPEIKIEHGQVSIQNGPEGPIQMDHAAGVIIIDLNRSEEDFRKTPDLLMGVGRDFVVIQSRDGLKSMPIEDDKNFVINREMVGKFFSSGYHILILPVIFPFVAFGQFLYFLLYMVAITLMSYIVTAFLREEYDFETRMRLSALALTPPTLVSLLAMFLGHQTGFWLVPLVALFYFGTMILLMRRLPT